MHETNTKNPVDFPRDPRLELMLETIESYLSETISGDRPLVIRELQSRVLAHWGHRLPERTPL